MEDYLNYDKILSNSLLNVVKVVLDLVINQGLDDRSLYFEFKTNVFGVVIPDFLKPKYPVSMPIALEKDYYKDLKLNEYGFEVTLLFNGLPSKLIIPFKSLLLFRDDMEHFELKFNPDLFSNELQVIEDAHQTTLDNKPQNTNDDDNIISLSQFQKFNKNNNNDDNS